MKRLFTLFLLLTALSYGRMLDAIAIIVEGQPVTTREIATVQHKFNISRQKAIDLLIQDRLQKAAMKDIVVTDEQVDEEIKHIAKRNHLSVAQLQQVLKAQGTSWSAYRNSIKTMIKQRIFFRDKVAKTVPQPTDAQLRSYYERHKSDFIMPAEIKVVEYDSISESALRRALQGKKTAKVTRRTKILKTDRLSPALLELLLRTPDGETTEPLNAGGRYVAYKVLSKTGRKPMSFESAKEAVASQWLVQQREHAIKDYFKKMKTAAHIRYLRK
jgi:parvulin-like peptidyl-prolyl isomerase